MTAQDLKVYLKQAMELEASVYTQDKAIAEAKTVLQKQKPILRKVQIKSIPAPSSPVLSPRPDTIIWVSLFMWAIIFSAVALVALVVFFLDFSFLALLALVASGFISYLLIKCIIKKKKRIKANEASYDYEMQKYKKALEKHKQDKEIAQKEYTEQVKIAQTEFSDATHRHEIATEAVDQMLVPFEESKEVLQRLYSLDILFPKYRNLVAVSTMYEYLASGRVSALEGPDGAYNLYESELRLNLIINKMDVIIQQLEDIKENQYSLYNVLKQTNVVLEEIASDVSELVSTAHDISDASKITAYCSALTAQNTAALKYIAILNG